MYYFDIIDMTLTLVPHLAAPCDITLPAMAATTNENYIGRFLSDGNGKVVYGNEDTINVYYSLIDWGFKLFQFSDDITPPDSYTSPQAVSYCLMDGTDEVAICYFYNAGPAIKAVRNVFALDPTDYMYGFFMEDVGVEINGQYIYVTGYYFHFDVENQATLYSSQLERAGDGSIDYTGAPDPFWVQLDRYVDRTGLDDNTSQARFLVDPSGANKFWYYGLMDSYNDPGQEVYFWYYNGSTFSTTITYGAWGTSRLAGLRLYGGKMHAIRDTGAVIQLYIESTGQVLVYQSDGNIAGINDVVMDMDYRDGTVVVAADVAGSIIVTLCASPYSSWSDITLSHLNDRGVTGILVLE